MNGNADVLDRVICSTMPVDNGIANHLVSSHIWNTVIALQYTVKAPLDRANLPDIVEDQARER